MNRPYILRFVGVPNIDRELRYVVAYPSLGARKVGSILREISLSDQAQQKNLSIHSMASPSRLPRNRYGILAKVCGLGCEPVSSQVRRILIPASPSRNQSFELIPTKKGEQPKHHDPLEKKEIHGEFDR